MRIIFFLLFITCSHNLLALYYHYWEQLVTPENTAITSVICDSDSVLYISAKNNGYNTGGIYRSTDHGRSWEKKNNGLTLKDIKQLAIDNFGNLYAAGQAKLYKSINKGDQWTIIHQDQFSNVDIIRCGYDSILLIGGKGTEGILRSADGGSSWGAVCDFTIEDGEQVISDINFAPNGVIYASTRTLYTEENAKVYASYDYGLNWEVFYEASTTYLMGLGFDNEGRLLLGSFGEGIKRFDFNDLSWTPIVSYSASPISFLTIPDNTIYAACESFPSLNGGVLISYDGGDSYNFNNDGFLPLANIACCLTRDLVGRVLVVNSGNLYRTFDTLFTVRSEWNRASKLLQASPNPFKSCTRINLNLEKQMGGIICIYNTRGECVFKRQIRSLESFDWEPTDNSCSVFILKVFSNSGAIAPIKLIVLH